MNLSNQNNSILTVFLLDDDPIFRLAIFTALENIKYQDIKILAQTEIAALSELLSQEIPNLLLLSIDLIRYPERLNSMAILCEQLHQKYPDLIIFLLTPIGTNKTIENILGVRGCCPKTIKIEELVEGLRICAEGKTFFIAEKKVSNNNQKIGGWLYNQCQFGIKQIENELEIINNYLKENLLSSWDILFWQGRKRELKVSRWLLSQLLPSGYHYVSNFLENEEDNNIENTPLLLNSFPSLSITNGNKNLIENAFDLSLLKIQSSVKNCTGKILEIDILKTNKKQELLIIIINQLKRIIEELKIITLTKEELLSRKIVLLKDLWQTSTVTFLSRYYPDQHSKENELNLFNLVWQETSIIEIEILDNIPFIADLFSYWIFEDNIIVDNESYTFGSKNGHEIEEILLQNLLINMANNIMQFILNSFSDDESIRHKLYDQERKSSRKIAMFRNNLTWKYRQEKYWENPNNIFEDEYQLFSLNYEGIIQLKIKHPRHQELTKLKGLPWFVTLAIEFKDGIGKTVKAIVDIIGKGLVYILTEVIGKGIGLIGKGILQGIGNKIKG